MDDSARLDAAVQGSPALVRAVGASATDGLSVVGGFVRDALLDRPHGDDIDLVVEGDAIEVAHRIGRALNARVVTHGRFGTAIVELPRAQWIDVVTARRESYAHPGALPDVEAGTLDDDLARRDFTVNAMAYRVTGPRAGELVDPHGGRADLAAGLIRILRPDSFVEDPSRILRAVRYAARIDGFRLERATEEAARAVAPDLDPASARVGDELRRMLREAEPWKAVEMASALGVPWITANRDTETTVHALTRFLATSDDPVVAEPWAMWLGLVLTRDALQRLAVDGWARGIGQEAAQWESVVARLAGAKRPSEIDALLRRVPAATAIVAAARGARQIPEWWARQRDLRLAISGEDLIGAGVSPGPAIGSALSRVRAAVLDGEVADRREDQLRLALDWIGA